MAGIYEASSWKELKGQSLFGGNEFIQKRSPHLKQKSAFTEVPKFDRRAYRPDLESLFSQSNRNNKSLRNQAIPKAHFEYGYLQKELADHLGPHYTTVSNIIRKKP